MLFDGVDLLILKTTTISLGPWILCSVCFENKSVRTLQTTSVSCLKQLFDIWSSHGVNVSVNWGHEEWTWKHVLLHPIGTSAIHFSAYVTASVTPKHSCLSFPILVILCLCLIRCSFWLAQNEQGSCGLNTCISMHIGFFHRTCQTGTMTRVEPSVLKVVQLIVLLFKYFTGRMSVWLFALEKKVSDLSRIDE